MPLFDVNNLPFNLLASAARTATTDSSPQNNPVNPGAYFILTVTAVSGTGGLQLRILLQDPNGGLTALNIAPPAITATGIFLYLVHPSVLGGAANLEQICALPLPSMFIARVEHLDASSYTYQLDEVLLV